MTRLLFRSLALLSGWVGLVTVVLTAGPLNASPRPSYPKCAVPPSSAAASTGGIMSDDDARLPPYDPPAGWKQEATSRGWVFTKGTNKVVVRRFDIDLKTVAALEVLPGETRHHAYLRKRLQTDGNFVEPGYVWVGDIAIEKHAGRCTYRVTGTRQWIGKAVTPQTTGLFHAMMTERELRTCYVEKAAPGQDVDCLCADFCSLFEIR